MHFLLNLITSIILAPFRMIKFIVYDVIIFGIVGGIASMIKSALRLIFRPFTLLLLAGGAAAFYIATDEQKKRVKALMGM